MKIVHLSFSDIGGAGIAAKNLHLALLKKGINSKFITIVNKGENIKEYYKFNIHSKNIIDRIRVKCKKIFSKLYQPFLDQNIKQNDGFEIFTLPYSLYDIHKNSLLIQADIIHLHWVSYGMIDYSLFFRNFKNKIIVWTLHDMNPFTGGCHHSDGCEKFKSNCENCFQLSGTNNKNISNKILTFKLKSLEFINSNKLIIISPSNWLKSLSQSSICFDKLNHYVIPNILSPIRDHISKDEARSILGLDKSSIVFLFVSDAIRNKRKGLEILVEAFNSISYNPNIIFITMGSKKLNYSINIKNKDFGYIDDHIKMNAIYKSADLLLMPSIAENFPNTIIESLLRGTPVFASRVGGIPEQINSENGLLIEAGNLNSWVFELQKYLEGHYLFDSNKLLNKAKEVYSEELIVNKHIEIYKNYFKE